MDKKFCPGQFRFCPRQKLFCPCRRTRQKQPNDSLLVYSSQGIRQTFLLLKTLYSKTLKMTNFGTGHLQKIVIFKLLLKPSFARSFGHLGLFARSNSLNANRHLARFVTFEVVICKVLL